MSNSFILNESSGLRSSQKVTVESSIQNKKLAYDNGRAMQSSKNIRGWQRLNGLPAHWHDQEQSALERDIRQSMILCILQLGNGTNILQHATATKNQLQAITTQFTPQVCCLQASKKAGPDPVNIVLVF